ncbi:surface-adhesin E family protein [Anthocerotibacter panamensis]|uniref:surface-adhesin E family protein n=1 Tax=Anthocerotibacter panamensis TaxID=2857077 RepID=UPI0036F3D5C3
MIASSSVQAADWVLVEPTQASNYYVDPTRIEVIGALRRFWIKVSNHQEEQIAGQSVKSYVLYATAHCGHSTYGETQILLYNRSGREVVRRNTPLVARRAAPGTAMNALIQFACHPKSTKFKGPQT